MNADFNSESPFELGHLLEAFKRHWLKLLAVGVLCTGATYAASYLVKPVYRAEVLATAAEDNSSAGLPQLLGGLGSVAAMAGIDFGPKSNIEVSLAMITSRQFLTDFIQEHNLMPELYAKQWDTANKTWKVPASEAPTLNDALRTFTLDICSVTRDRRTGLVRVVVEWTDREKAAFWANELVRRVNEASRQNAISEAQRSVEFLNKELAKTNVLELQQAIYRLVEAQINRVVVANVRQEFAFKVIDPATVPDAKFKVRPKRLMYALGGAFIGGLVDVALLFFFVMRGRRSGTAGATA
jgi:uncharacterized protein involved in exopolysaccharide biosynthesis